MKSSIYKNGLIIAGPCSVESEDQLWETAIDLIKTGKVDIFRAGIWKPRTHPDLFNGVGEIGLKWLLDLKKETRIISAVEIATVKQLELAQKYEVDIVWIGARTTINPFIVDEISHYLKDSSQSVLIKNPINPNLEAWVGAVERFQINNVQNIGIVHRGFSVYDKTIYRNAPIWEIPLEMKKRFPGIPMICDPSHICGNTSNLLEISKKSIQMGFDGLMLEVHNNPDSALTDKDQQLTPEEFLKILNLIVLEKNLVDSEEDKIRLLRNQIDLLDQGILQQIKHRMSLIEEVGMLKKENNMNVLQPDRWKEVLTNNIKLARKFNLDIDFVKKYMENIHTESIRLQNQI